MRDFMEPVRDLVSTVLALQMHEGSLPARQLGAGTGALASG